VFPAVRGIRNKPEPPGGFDNQTCPQEPVPIDNYPVSVYRRAFLLCVAGSAGRYPIKEPQRRQVERMRPSRAGPSSQSRGSICVKQRAGVLAASILAAVGFLSRPPGAGVPVLAAVEVLAAVPVVNPAGVVTVPASGEPVEVSAAVVLAASVPGVAAPVLASGPVAVLPAAVVSAVAGRVQSRRRSASNPAASGVPVVASPGAGAAGPAVGVATVPAVGLWACSAAGFGVRGRCPGGRRGRVSAVPSGFPGVVVLASVSVVVVMASVLFLYLASRAQHRGRALWSLYGIGGAGATYSVRAAPPTS
jgi:hypothetical protein